MSDLALRDEVYALEAEMAKMPQIDIPVRHYFSPGVYAREITIPTGSTITGKIHKYAQLNILSFGDISVLTEEGIKRVQAPFTIVSPPGTKRVAYAHSECVWTTVHGTYETDLAELEYTFIAQTEEEYINHCLSMLGELKCLG